MGRAGAGVSHRERPGLGRIGQNRCDRFLVVGQLLSGRLVSSYVEVCAEALARAHARSGSASAISGYLGKGTSFDRAMGRFAAAYADQNLRGLQAFAAAAADGRMMVASGI